MSTKNIWVMLDATANPQVVLTNRHKEVSSGDTIKWKKKDEDDDFEISSLVPAGHGTAFLDPEINKRRTKLTCEFSPDSSGKDYPYTLTVTVDQLGGLKQYDTTESIRSSIEDEFSEGGRPVIRN